MKLDTSLVARALPPGTMRYYAWLFTPEAQRDVMAALFLIETELHDTSRAPHEVAHLRLQWWREEIERLISGKAQHPATLVLQAAAQPCVDFKLLHDVVHSAAQELANTTYETDTELRQYLHCGQGSLLQLGSQYLCETPTGTLLDAATQLGAFIRQVEILRDLRQDLNHGRLYLPLAALDALNIEYETIQASDWPDGFVKMLKSVCAQHLAGYATLKQSLLSSEKKTLRPLLVLSELHAQVLQTISTDPVTYTRQRVELGAIRKLWIAWRAARTAS